MLRVLLKRGGAGTMPEGDAEMSDKRSLVRSRGELRASGEEDGGSWRDLW